jgi:hypothetical protein
MELDTHEQLRRLGAELEATQRRVLQLEAEREKGPAHAGRRSFLKLAVAGAAAGAGTVALASTPAAATTGQALLLGQANHSSANADVSGLENGTFTELAVNVFQVKNWASSSLGPDGNFRTAIYGAATGPETVIGPNTGVRVGIHGEALSMGDATSRGVGVLGCANRTIGLLLPATGTGVYGTAEGAGTGVKGLAYNGAAVGVHGVAGDTVGVQAEATGSGGVGLNAVAPTTAVAARVEGRFRQVSALAPGAPTFFANAGEQWRDSLGDLYICTVAGAPGTWRKVVAQHPSYPSAGGSLNLLATPIRVLDTRPGSTEPQNNGHNQVAANQELVTSVTGVSVGGVSVPAGAKGFFGNLTAVPLTDGWITMWAENVAIPGTSNLNFKPGVAIANSFICALSPAGQVRIKPSATTHILLDIVGFLY